MNLLEFKRFAELRKQYNWLVIDDPYGDGKYKIGDIVINTSIEPGVHVADVKSISAFLASYSKLQAAVEALGLKSFGVNLELKDNIVAAIEKLSTKPLAVIIGTQSNLTGYFGVLDALKIPYMPITVQSTLYDEIRLVNLLGVLVKVVTTNLTTYSEIEMVNIINLFVGQFQSISDLEASLIALQGVPFTPGDFKECVTAADVSMYLTNRILAEAQLPTRIVMTTPMYLKALEDLGVREKIEDLANATISLAQLNEISIQERVLYKSLIEFSILSHLSYEVQDKYYSNIYAKLNVVFPDPDMLMHIQDTNRIMEISPLVYGSILGFLVDKDITHVNISSVIKSAIWAKLIDYENTLLDQMDPEDLEELYLFEN